MQAVVRSTSHNHTQVLDRRDHSALMLAARITLPHFSVSSATSFPNSAGVIGMGSPAKTGLQLRVGQYRVHRLVSERVKWRKRKVSH